MHQGCLSAKGEMVPRAKFEKLNCQKSKPSLVAPRCGFTRLSVLNKSSINGESYGKSSDGLFFRYEIKI